MTPGRGFDVQRAIAFLSGPELGDRHRAALPPRPDYDSLARYARELGHDLSPQAVEAAFRLMMRARLLASRKPSRIDDKDR